MRPLWAALLAFSLAVLPGSTACGSEPDELDDPDLSASPQNPDGIAYPTDHLGGSQRTATRPGDRIPNFAFRAYRSGRQGGLETLSLAEFYDPLEKRHKVLHIQTAGTWCAICSAELAATIPQTEALLAKGIVFLEVVVSGATAGKGPNLSEVDNWVESHGTTFPTAIDVRARRLGALGVSGVAMPHDILIDTRTMEILDSSVGAPLDVSRYGLDGIDFVTKNPPSYPIAGSP